MGLLDRVTTEAPAQPSRVYLYAAEKWGKTSFAAYAPKPIFLMTSGETGLLDLINYAQIGPTPHFPDDFKAWPDLLDAVDAVGNEDHDYRTLVIDTANGAERLLADHVLATMFNGQMTGNNGYTSYGKGDLACIPQWSEFLRRLDRVRTRRRMSIILLAHSRIKSVNNPEGDDYDQLRPEGIDKLWPLTHKWASVIAAGTYKVFVKDDKAQGGRERVIKTQPTAAVTGGNRYGLPEVIGCGKSAADAWNAFAKAIGDARKAAVVKQKQQQPTASGNGKPTEPPAQQTQQTATPVPEGEQRADFTPAAKSATPPATATTSATRTAAPSAADPPAPATTSEPAAKPVTAAERRTAPPPVKPNPAFPVIELLHKLGVSWPEVRDARPGKGLEIANAAELGKLGPDTNITDLTDGQRSKLVRELEARVAEKEQRKRQRAASNARREAEIVAQEVTAS